MGENYVLGLDLGIGSIGWGLISNQKGEEKIIDFGVRIFESSEENGGKDRKSQERRGFRGVRRLVRRKHFKKEMLKNHLEFIKLVTKEQLAHYYETNKNDAYELRTRALDFKISEEELAAILIHICGHRGYKEFYESDENELVTEEMKEETKEDKMGVDAFNKLFHAQKYRTVGEMFCKDEAFKNSIRNKDTKEERFLPTRKEIEKEAHLILIKQAEFYKQLTDANVKRTMELIFSQRDFEDGPGDKNDVYRKYTGFLGSIGQCIFYGKERAFRGTVISDVYAVVNALSQNLYTDKDTGELTLNRQVAYELIYTLMLNGSLGKKEVKSICDKHHTAVTIKTDGLAKSNKYLKNAKKLIEVSGLNWDEFASEEQFDLEKPSRLHQMGEVLSKFQTPKRKQSELSKLSWASPMLIKNAMALKFSGTANVCYAFMIDAINAFLKGEVYGHFQANKIKELEKQKVENKQYKIPILEDEFITKNPVVFRTINETRKIINAIIDKHGSPSVINIEVASDVNRSYEERREIQRIQNKNEKLNDALKQKIAELYNIHIEDISYTMLDKYKLYEQQEGKCLYSDAVLDKSRLFEGIYEIDHIVPYSLILDNSLHNKALVLYSENQFKKQRTPLQYLSSDKQEKFLEKVNELFRAGKISERKYQYLMLPNIYDPKCQELLKDWKSRNINDTRYITKYIVSYIANNLKFAGETKINGIKGAYTARFRKLWLNEATWGSKDRENSNLHHAVDAIVVANLTPAYIEIASDNRKLYQMFKTAGKVETQDYKQYLSNCMAKMKKIYGFSEEYTKALLTKKGKVPSVIPNLRDEVDIRFNDEDQSLFDEQVRLFYHDEGFAKGIHMPLVSYKQNKKLQGQITADNPLNLKEIDGQTWKVKRKKIIEVSSKDIAKILTGDADLITTLEEILSGKDDKYTIERYLKDNNQKYFTTKKGTIVHKVTMKEKTAENVFYKIISENNKTALAANNYYCTEIYEDIDGNCRLRGIRRVDVIKKNKKLWLGCEPPQNYAKHKMYLFSGEYIKVFDKNNKCKFSGFFKFSSILGGKNQRILGVWNNKPYDSAKDYFTLSKTDTIEKYHIDLLGNIGGKIKCGEPLLLLKEKK